MRVIVSSFLLLCLSGSPVAYAQSSLDATTKQQLVKLERKYFGHSFDSDSDDSRVSRVEQLIFGENNVGSAKERIQKIVAVSPVEEQQAVPDEAAASSTKSKRRKSTAAAGQTNTAQAAAQSQDFVPGQDSASSLPAPAPPIVKTNKHSLMGQDALELKDYPHITALEKTILGRSFAGQPLSARLARLETQAFGAPSMLPDFSQRTDALEEYAERKLHQQPFGVENETADSSAQSGGRAANANLPLSSATVQSAPGNQPDYPHVTSLEKSILGQTFVGENLVLRLNRLETTAFGQPSTNPDMSQRTDGLDKYVAKKLHKKPFGEQQEQDADTANARGGGQASPQSGGSSKALGMVANALLGVAGMGRGPMGMMGPGLGMGRGGFAGPRAGQKQQTAPPPAPEKDDDPEVFTALPPPREARILTKIGWCEVKTFGHTFQSMHLTDRLRQLSRQLDFETSKSDLELMDDIGAMIKVVQVHQSTPGGTPIGAASRPAVH